jgi:hypothetical protein
MPPAPSAAPKPARAGPGLRPTADALERLLTEAGFLTAAEGERGVGLARPVPAGGWTRAFSQLVREKRAVSVRLVANGPPLWAGLERVGWILALRPDAELRPWIAPALVAGVPCTPDEARARLAAARQVIEGESSAATVARWFGAAEPTCAATG